MAHTGEPDPLFDIKCAFYIGNYQQCVNEAQKLKVSGDLKLERDIILYRAFIAQNKFNVVTTEINSSSPPALQALKTLAQYQAAKSDKRKREEIVKSLEVEIEKGFQTENSTLLLVAGTIFLYEEDYDSALRALNQSEALECMALTVQILVKMDRPDHAKKELKRMHDVDEDHLLTQLSTASLNLYLGGDKLQESFYIYQELSDKFGSTLSLLNCLAVSHMTQGRFEEAEPLLQEALEKDSNNPETLTNLVVLSQHQGKSTEVTNRYIAQLEDSHPDYYVVKEMVAKENEFDRLASNYQASVA